MGPVQRKVTYRLYPSTKQEEGLRLLLGRHQRLYNAALEQRISAYRRQGKTVSFAEQCRDLTALRGEDPDYGGVNAQSCQVTLKRLDLAFKHFFRRVRERKSKAGFPRFKSLRRFSGWGYKTHGDGWRLQAGEGMKHGRVRLSGVGDIRIRGKARTEGTPKTLEVMHKQGRWYASVTVVCEPKRARLGNGAAGLDWGVETFATVANQDGSTCWGRSKTPPLGRSRRPPFESSGSLNESVAQQTASR
jgi:putative transposase